MSVLNDLMLDEVHVYIMYDQNEYDQNEYNNSQNVLSTLINVIYFRHIRLHGKRR